MLSQTLVYRLQSSSLCLQDHASVHVQLSPMTFCSARREALSQPAIGKPFKCAIYPSEAKRLFHYFDVRNSWPLGWTLTAISHHPTTFLFVVVLFEPLAKLGRFPKCSRFSTSMMSLIGVSLKDVFIKFAHIEFPLFKVSHYIHCTLRLLAI